MKYKYTGWYVNISRGDFLIFFLLLHKKFLNQKNYYNFVLSYNRLRFEL